VAANLLVRRAAFDEIGGFYEGLRAAEDTDFTWRLQQAGWGLELRSQAWVEHRYRATLTELRQQWRGYAAGRAWLARRYEGFSPQRAHSRALARVRRALRSRRRTLRSAWGPREARQGPLDSARGAPPVTGGPWPIEGRASPLDRGKYLAIDTLLALEESAGFLLSNRPVVTDSVRASAGEVHVVFVADQFPSPDDPLVELASTLEAARVEAAGRPPVLPAAARGLQIHYREDDGLAERLAAFVHLVLRHPGRSVRDALVRGPQEPPLMALAPAVRRLQQDPRARVQPLGAGQAPAVARRIAALAGRRALATRAGHRAG
jgi:hypothetical protein